MMRDKMALLPGIGQTHHHVFIRLVAWGYKIKLWHIKLCPAMYTLHGCYVDTNTNVTGFAKRGLIRAIINI